MSNLTIDNLEQVVMELIINAGDAKSYAMQALSYAKSGDYEKADMLLASARDAELKAHGVQTQLIGLDMGEGKIPVNLILVHAQDHIMNAMLAKELIAEMIHLYKTIDAKKTG